MTSARETRSKIRVAVVITPCSSIKTVSADSSLHAKKLKRASQSTVAQNWLEKLKSVSGTLIEASDLYGGTGFSIARKTASAFNADLLVISAGLGLVKSTSQIPSYDLAASSGLADVRTRINGAFDEEEWWTSVSRGRFSTSLTKSLETDDDGLVLIAITRSYAPLISSALAGLPNCKRERLRLFGVVEDLLPDILRAQLMPYDARLDTIVPGTRGSFAQRAMEHFGSMLAALQNFPVTVTAQKAVVGRLMLRTKPASVVRRPSITDKALDAEIRRFIKRDLSRSAALRELRDVKQMACEQNRFRRRYEALIQ